ncbi:MAG: hypothetical protein AAGJ83_15935, partial [Planctomycetota bacterium]
MDQGLTQRDIGQSERVLTEKDWDDLIGEIVDRLLADPEAELDDLLERAREREDEIREIVEHLRLMQRWTDDSIPDVTGPSGSEDASNTIGDSASVSAERRLGDFELLEEIGRGGMGVISRAREVSLDRIVALKTLPFAALADPRRIERFKL